MPTQAGEEPPLMKDVLDVDQSMKDDWRWQFGNRIKSLDVLSRYVKYSDEELAALKARNKNELHMAIPPYYLNLIKDKSNPHLDPVGIQCCPDIAEYTFEEAGVSDPLNEDEQMPVEGIVHRYPDRCLFLCTNICSMYCRFCTRKREWDGGDMPKSKAQVDKMLEYIRSTPSIRDVILSGGDPISLPMKNLDYILTELRKIEHVEMIRIGTRFPVTLPQRFYDYDVLGVLEKNAPIWINTHFNHVTEVDTPEVRLAIKTIQKTGCIVSNQSVLLKGVNDTVKDMLALNHALLKIGIRPYYLYRCDDIKGTKHLQTSIQCGTDIIRGMSGFTSGLAIPTYVVDVSGGGGKIPVNPSYADVDTGGNTILTSYEGKSYRYSE